MRYVGRAIQTGVRPHYCFFPIKMKFCFAFQDKKELVLLMYMRCMPRLSWWDYAEFECPSVDKTVKPLRIESPVGISWEFTTAAVRLGSR